jgi:amino acid permease
MLLSDKHKNVEYGAIPVSPRLDHKNRGDAIVSAYNFGTISNLLSTLISGSMFSLPWSFHIAGIYGGSVVVLIIAVISYETIRALLSAQREIYLKTGDVVGYPELAASLLKSDNWSKAIQTATVISCIGGNIGYLIFIGGIASQLLDMPSLDTTIFAAIALIFLSFIRSFSDLSIFTTIGVAANLGSFVAVFVMGTTLDSATYEVVYFQVYPTLTFVGSATFMFGIHYCIVSMGAEILTRYKDMHGSSVSGYSTPLPAHRIVTPLPTLEYDLAIAFVISTIGVIALGVTGSIFYSGGDYVR